MKSNLLFKLLLMAGAPLVLWASREPVAAMWRWFSDRDAVEASMHAFGIWGPVVLFVLFILQVFLAFIPGQALMVGCGFLYGFWGGFLLSWLSLVAGGELAYVLARQYGRPFAERWIAPDVISRWNKASWGQGIGFFAIMLVMPLVPNDAMCYVAGLGSISHRRFSIANLVGRGMACVLTSAAGALGGNLPWQGWAALIAVFVLMGVAWQIGKHRTSNLFIA
jgi:uncharacterized membrane protein YdjX (TVP38/TMEM64 family)